MTTMRQGSPADGPISRDSRDAFLGRQVLDSLGTPGDLVKVQVRPLGGGHYRVNVLVGRDLARSRIADSFFLSADGEGNITKSSPRIARLY
jgi:hypothetical protein